MKLLFTCSSRKWGGNEKWTAMAANVMSLNHDVFYGYRAARIIKSVHPGVRFVRLPFLNELDLLTMIGLILLIRRHKIGCIISTKRKEYFLCGMVSRLCRIKHIIRLGIVRPLHNSFRDRLLFRRLNDAVLVNAVPIKTRLLQSPYMKTHPVEVIHNGVSLPERSRKRRSGKFVISSAGSLIRRKKFHFLIEAVAQIPLSVRNGLLLYVIGSGPEETALRHLIRDTGLEQTVILTGFEERPEKRIAESDLFVLCSENEGLSNAMLEAMAAGVPVLVTPAGGTRDVIQPGVNGFLAENTDPLVLAETIQHIIARNDLKQIGTRARDTIQSAFTVERMYKHLTQFLEKVIDEKV
jgi:glycosyltransferase involved in cell wall biosynthesis